MSGPGRITQFEDKSISQRNEHQSLSGSIVPQSSINWWNEAEADLFSKWAYAFEKYTSFNNPYFDYFFSGQDIQITIDGLDGRDPLPIYSFAYNIQQQKQPLYGFWSYTYDAMLRGTRIVTGAFSLISTAPYLLTSKIAEAAQIRAKTVASKQVNNLHQVRGLDTDETLINTYWRRHYDTNLEATQQHLFSIHPPFNFVIRYGLQQTSVTHDNPSYSASEIRNKYGYDTMMADLNERLVKLPFEEMDMQILLENVELISKQTEYDTEGTPLLETYTFMARDERLLKPEDGSMQKVYVPSDNAISTSSSGGGAPRASQIT